MCSQLFFFHYIMVSYIPISISYNIGKITDLFLYIYFVNCAGRPLLNCWLIVCQSPGSSQGTLLLAILGVTCDAGNWSLGLTYKKESALSLNHIPCQKIHYCSKSSWRYFADPQQWSYFIVFRENIKISLGSLQIIYEAQKIIENQGKMHSY